MTTWADIKLASLQKMFAAEGTTIPTDESTMDYLASMPQACNEALQLLATAGKFIIKSISIAHFPVKNLIDNNTAKAIRSICDDACEYKADGAKSYYFEVVGVGDCSIYVDGTLQKVIRIDSASSYVTFKGLIFNPNKKSVRLVFSTEYPMSIKNVALYHCTFPSDSEVQDYKDNVKYKMDEVVSDFYQLDSQEIYYEGDNDTYLKTSDYFQEGDRVLVLPRDMIGNYTIYYKAYPEQITIGTDDEYVLPIDPEVATLIPLYIASQLYKDDDNGIATAYRNEFEVAFERLSQKTNVPTKEKIVSESGWI